MVNIEDYSRILKGIDKDLEKISNTTKRLKDERKNVINNLKEYLIENDLESITLDGYTLKRSTTTKKKKINKEEFLEKVLEDKGEQVKQQLTDIAESVFEEEQVEKFSLKKTKD